jgi:hypothetical protein
MRRLSTGAHLHAEAGALEPEPKCGDQDRAAQDQEAAKRGKVAEAEIDLAGEPARRMHRLRVWPPDISHRCEGHEDQAHSQQHLVELVAAIKPAIKQALDEDAAERGRNEGANESGHEGHADPSHQARHHIAAEHRKDAMREIDEPHQPHCHRQPDRDQVQHHGEGETVKTNADDRGQRVGHGAPQTCPSPRLSPRRQGAEELGASSVKSPAAKR